MITLLENVVTVETDEELEMIELFLEEHYFDFDLLVNHFLVYDPTEELFEEFLDSDLEVLMNEGTAQRKVVIRNGKRKIIFKCKPGEKKIGPRRCVRRKSSELAKMRRRARRAARKSKNKRGRALRKRKISLRRRKTLGGTNKKHKH
jgi:hypothetical protein